MIDCWNQISIAIGTKNPFHSKILKLVKRGISFQYKKNDIGFVDMVIKAMIAEKELAKATFKEDNEKEIHRQNITVISDYQRQGIATAIYVFAECITEKKLINFWGDKKSKDGCRLWKQPNRPFG
jgi:hypothetical protein